MGPPEGSEKVGGHVPPQVNGGVMETCNIQLITPRAKAWYESFVRLMSSGALGAYTVP